MSKESLKNITDRTEIGFVFTILFSLMLGLFTLFSVIVLIEYVIDESVSFPIYMTLCIPAMLLFLVTIMALNVANGLSISKVSESLNCLRALYISLFFPIVLVSFIVACFKDGFHTSLIFGFPFFFLGMLILPWSAYVLADEAKVIARENLVFISCYHCRYPFQMNRLDFEGMCPVCGALNRLQPLASPPQGEPDEPENQQPGRQ
ncbi:MAG: hypothetical protein JSW28_10680 [Thermoplasmata archaeon]|nr:MAG: hypothetical protein JSW28_10680 [Thermoplasmata archaeon]